MPNIGCSDEAGSAATNDTLPAGTCLLSYDAVEGRLSFVLSNGKGLPWSGGLARAQSNSGGGGSAGSGNVGGGSGGWLGGGGSGGNCLRACGAREACVGTECACVAPYKRCGYDCVDFLTDAW